MSECAVGRGPDEWRRRRAFHMSRRCHPTVSIPRRLICRFLICSPVGAPPPGPLRARVGAVLGSGHKTLGRAFRGRKQRGPILARAEAELPASVSRVFVSIASSTRGCAPSSTRSTSPAKLARSQGSSAFHRREYPETPPEHNLACSQHIHLGLGQLKLRLGHADPISSPAPCFVSQDDNSRVERRTPCPRSSTRS